MSQEGKRVLLVDDDVDFLEANQVALEAAGLQVLTATNSREGVALAEAEKPDLIVMDLMMEELHSGFAAVQALNAHEATRDIPVIMVSAVTTDTGFRLDNEEGKLDWLKVMEFINKPVDPVELARKITSILKDQK
jgi:CheY-like chemotaxis protein